MVTIAVLVLKAPNGMVVSAGGILHTVAAVRLGWVRFRGTRGETGFGQNRFSPKPVLTDPKTGVIFCQNRFGLRAETGFDKS